MVKLQPYHIDIWYMPIKVISADTIKYYHSFLSKNEISHCDTFYFSKEKNRYLLTRYMIGKLLYEYTGDINMSLKLEYNPWGRPFIPSAHNLFKIDFNISHNDEYIVCCIVSEGKIGIDIESYSKHRSPFIAEDFMAGPEIADLKDKSGPEWNKRFIEFWTLKESFIKGVGKGMSIPLDSFYFLINKSNIRFFDEKSQGSSDDWHFLLFEGQWCNSLAIAISFNVKHSYMPAYTINRFVLFDENPGTQDMPFCLSATSFKSTLAVTQSL